MAEETWAMEYCDGRNNQLLIWQDGPVVRFSYRSETASHRGRDASAATGRMADEVVVELWSRVQALAGHSEWHTDQDNHAPMQIFIAGKEPHDQSGAESHETTY